MASNLQLTELEQRVLECIRTSAFIKPTADDIRYFLRHTITGAEVNQAISDLVQKSFISADENLRYVAVGGAL